MGQYRLGGGTNASKKDSGIALGLGCDGNAWRQFVGVNFFGSKNIETIHPAKPKLPVSGAQV
jgi:hypothetical protein